MLEIHEILAIIMAVFSLVFLILFIRSRFKDASYKMLLIELGGCIAFAVITIISVIPGSESNFELGPIKYKIKTPSKIAKLVGDKEKTFEAQNTDNNNPKSLIFSASSTSESISPELNFFVGKEYIKIVNESKDGKERIFSATLPPGKRFKAASPEQVIINVIPHSFLSKILVWKDSLNEDEAKAVREYYKSNTPK